MLYQLVVFLHVLAVLGYLLAHGVSAAVSFALQKERDIARVRALLDLSAASYPLMMSLMWAFLLFGIIATFLGGWWGRGWVWTSLALGFVIFVLMAVFGANHYGEARKAAGLRYNVKGKWFPPEPAKAIFNAWNEEVQRTVPPDRLLVFEVKDGWEPLCRFLGVPVPSTPFPHANKGDSFEKDFVKRIADRGKAQ